jgi:hypothetical protein
MASLSQRGDGLPSIQSLPEGFKVLDAEFGPGFYCGSCNVEAVP